jgi:hypothetical protein
MRRLGGLAVVLALISSAGCRQIFGITDTDTASSDGAEADGPVATGDAESLDAAPDAPVDAVPFSPDLCPADYDRTIGSMPASRYRRINSNRPFAVHHADCSDDAPGWTHLIALDTAEESQSAASWNPQAFKYVGVVQAPAQPAVDAGWYRFTGEPNTVPWSQALGQPDDDGDDVEDGEESLGVIQGFGNLADVGGTMAYYAICECDGRPIDPAVAAMIPAP